MRQLLYRLSWDRDFKRKFIVISCSCLGAVALCSVFVPVGINLLTSNNNETVIEEYTDEGTKYDILFRDNSFDNQEQSESINTNQENPNQTNETNNEGYSPAPYNPGGGDAPIQHTHSWYVVIDSYPWDETVYIQTGTKYICRNCGYVCYDLNTANNHASNYGHGYKTEAIMETRTIHHDGTSHEECSCGARR